MTQQSQELQDDHLDAEQVLRIGFLIAHGMGQQQRYQQLAEFSTAICAAIGIDPSSAKPHFVVLDDSPEKEVHIDIDLTPGSESSSDSTHFRELREHCRNHLDSRGKKRIQIVIRELYWAYKIRKGTNIFSVLGWFSGAVFRELLPNHSPVSTVGPADTQDSSIHGSALRFLWLGWIILELYMIVALVLGGIGWFGIQAVQSIQYASQSTDLTLDYLLSQTWPVVLFSVGMFGVYIYLTKGVVRSTTPAVPNEIGEFRLEAPSKLGLGKAAHSWLVFPLFAVGVTAANIAWYFDQEVPIATFFAVASLTMLYFYFVLLYRTSLTGNSIWLCIWLSMATIVIELPFLLTAAYRAIVSSKLPIALLPLSLVGVLAFIAIYRTVAGSFTKVLREPANAAGCVVLGSMAIVGALYSLQDFLIGTERALAANATCLGLLVVILALLQLYIVEYFGDISVFITQNENHKSTELRKSILDEAERQLKHLFGLVSSEKKLGIHFAAVVAHSLGCCVTYDALCRLHNKLHAVGDDNSLDSVQKSFRAYVTYGCILEIVRFYMGRRASSSPIYDTISEHGTQLYHSTDLGHEVTPLFTANGSKSARWFNIRSLMDPFTWPGLVSFGSETATIPTTVINSMIWPVKDHMDYMSNADVLACLRSLLCRLICEYTPPTTESKK